MPARLAWTLLGLTIVAGCRSTPAGLSSVHSLPTEPLVTRPSPSVNYHTTRRPESLQFVPPTARWETAGWSVERRPIETLRLGYGPDRILIIGGIHGDEPEGLALTERFADELQTRPDFLRGRTVLLIRDLNPDGTDRATRQNARAVDLNRNFPARNWKHEPKGRFASGPSPASEPETEVLLTLLDSFRPARIIVMHSTRGEALVNYDGPAIELARRMADANGYRVADSIGYPTPGSLGSYAGIDLGIPIITLELPRRVSDDRAWLDNRDALFAAVQFATRPTLGCLPPEPLVRDCPTAALRCGPSACYEPQCPGQPGCHGQSACPGQLGCHDQRAERVGPAACATQLCIRRRCCP